MLTPLIHVHGGRDSSDVVGAYVFSATLAIQDITGLAQSGLTASHMSKRLEGSAESQALLFALTDLQAPRPLGPLGFPAVHVDDLADIDAWVFISLPLLEDTRVIEATVTLDASIAPLPGEPVPPEPWVAALSLIDDLSHLLSRPTRHLWETHTPSASTVSPASEFLTAAGYNPAYRETQATFTIPLPSAAAPNGRTVVRNMDFSATDLPDLRGLLTASSLDYPRGDLVLDAVEWTEQRVRDASARLMDRGGNQLTALARDSTGKVIGMAEAVRYDSDDPSLMELGLIYVSPEHRRRGAGTELVRDVLAAAKLEWPDAATGYISFPADSQAAAALLAHYSPATISTTTAWQKR